MICSFLDHFKCFIVKVQRLKTSTVQDEGLLWPVEGPTDQSPEIHSQTPSHDQDLQTIKGSIELPTTGLLRPIEGSMFHRLTHRQPNQLLMKGIFFVSHPFQVQVLIFWD